MNHCEAPTTTQTKSLTVALAGNPNTGKTSLFNALTGMRNKVANYPGVTVEKKIGVFAIAGGDASLVDLPGTYGLVPHSPDEQVVHDVLLGQQAGTPRPDLVVAVLDGSNLERNLFVTSQLLELDIPLVVAVNMIDMAEQRGIHIDVPALSQVLGVPVVATIASRGEGIAELRAVIETELKQHKSVAWDGLALPEPVKSACVELAAMLRERSLVPSGVVNQQALQLITSETYEQHLLGKQESVLRTTLHRARQQLEDAGINWRATAALARFQWAQSVCGRVVTQQPSVREHTLSDRLDEVLTHRIWGITIFVGLMAFIFQSVYSWATVPMDLITAFFGRVGTAIAAVVPPGAIQSLLVDGVVAGVGSVIVFLPQIMFLFFFITLLEDSGYMARVAFVLDRLMARVGLNGKAAIPLISAYACAIPGIMAARTIENAKDRLVTILVAPLMSCSARLPVYTLMIGAFVPSVKVAWLFNLKGLTLLSMYLLGTVAAVAVAWLLKGTMLQSERTSFVMELPPYRIPNIRNVLLTMWERSMVFVRRAGTLIFTISIILWALLSYPRDHRVVEQSALEQRAVQTQYALRLEHVPPDQRSELLAQQVDDLSALESQQAGAILRHSFAGRLGHFIEPVIRPLGFDWKIGIGLIASFAAREVFVSTMAVVYNIGDTGATSTSLIEAIQSDVNAQTGLPVFTPLVAVSLMVFFVLACQCMSTVAITRRETNTWRWPLFMVAYMTGLAYAASFVVYQGGMLLGFQ